MNGISFQKVPQGLIVIFLFIALGLMMPRIYRAYPLESIQADLPREIAHWRAEPEDHFYNSQTIFQHIDGEAEVYLAYNMMRCFSRRFTSPEGDALVMDIFNMGTPEDAFGIFTHDQDGEVLKIGQGALYRAGWLSFWKGSFFVSVFAERETPETRNAVEDLGARVSALIRDEGPRPALLLRLPPAGLRDHSIRFLHEQSVLNHHFYLSDENILLLGHETDAVMAEYTRLETHAVLLLVTYPTAQRATEAFESFRKNYLPDADESGLAMLEDHSWCAAAKRELLLAVVLEAGSRPLAEDLLHEAIKP